jgi:hypothetical protein
VQHTLAFSYLLLYEKVLVRHIIFKCYKRLYKFHYVILSKNKAILFNKKFQIIKNITKTALNIMLCRFSNFFDFSKKLLL